MPEERQEEKSRLMTAKRLLWYVGFLTYSENVPTVGSSPTKATDFLHACARSRERAQCGEREKEVITRKSGLQIKNSDGWKDSGGNFMARGNKKAKYSADEKRAYYAGVAYAKAKKGKRCNFKTKKEKDSFRNGFNKVK